MDFLAANPDLKRGTVCVPGCGSGYDVREFAKAGFDAFGFDIAPSAIPLAEEKTKAAGLTAKFALADFLRDEPPQQFDWLFEHTLYCAIQPTEREDYVRAVLRWLKPGGNYLAVNYILCGPDGPPWPTTRGNCCEDFRRILNCCPTGCRARIRTATGKEQMFWWRRSLADGHRLINSTRRLLFCHARRSRLHEAAGI